MPLEYEKEMLNEFEGRSCLLITAGGLNIQKIAFLSIEAYLNEKSMALLVNFNDEDKAMALRTNSPFVHDVGLLQRAKRKMSYMKGGVYVASSRVFVADMLDGTIDITRIGCIFVNNVELVGEMSSEAFIVHMFRIKNKNGLVRGFCESPVPLSFGFSPLDRKMRSLRVDKVLFYPRFHKKVEESLNGDVELVEVILKLPGKATQLQIVLMEIIDNLLRVGLRGLEKEEMNAEMVVFGSLSKIFKSAGMSNYRIAEDIYNMRTLIFLLFSGDAGSFYGYVRKVFSEQVELGKDSSWINLTISHVLMDKSKELFEDAFEKTKERFKGQGICSDVIDDVGSYLYGLSSKEAKFFCSLNPKIRKLVEILEDMTGIRCIVLVSGRVVKEMLIGILSRFGFVSAMEESEGRMCVLSHYEFKYCELEYESVVFVEPSQDSVRKIEIYGTEHKVIVYFLVYCNSLEEQRYLNEIRREKVAFEKLIEERGRLPLRLDDLDDAIDLDDDLDEERYLIMVDVRELRSDLPFYLFKAKNEICISTLLVGDYVLGSKTCIERKTVVDFISSLNSGRLYLQARMLCHKYANPLLLLEFEGRPCISDYYVHSQDMFKNSVIARFALFLSNFNQIRIIWSESRLFSTKVIRDLQKREEEIPVVSEESAMDPTLQEILLSIPGMNELNIRKAMRNFCNLREIVFSSKERLDDVFGTDSSSLIYGFFRKRL